LFFWGYKKLTAYRPRIWVFWNMTLCLSVIGTDVSKAPAFFEIQESLIQWQRVTYQKSWTSLPPLREIQILHLEGCILLNVIGFMTHVFISGEAVYA